MYGKWRTRRNSTFRIALLLIYTAFSSSGSSSAAAAAPINLKEVQFGQDGLTAGRAVCITALFSSSVNQSKFASALEGVQLLVLSSDLQWLGIQPLRSARAEGDNGSYALLFDNVTFPTAGQYALVFYGQLPDEAGKIQAVSISTAIGVAGEPDSVHAPYQPDKDAISGLTEILVHSVATSVHQQRSISLAELVSSPNQTAVQGNSSSSSQANGNHTLSNLAVPPRLYRVVLSNQGPCTPGLATTYRWTFTDASTGAPVTDLQGSDGTEGEMPVVIVSSNLSFAMLTTARPDPVDPRRNSSSSDMQGHAVVNLPARRSNGSFAPDHAATNSSNTLGAGSKSQQQSGGRRLLQQLFPASAGHWRMLQADSGNTASSSRLFGPSVSASVILPEYGAYVFVGEASSTDGVIVVPFVVSCKHMQAAPALPQPANSSAGDMQHGYGAANIWMMTLLAVCLQWSLL